jgi:hypothetical protein
LFAASLTGCVQKPSGLRASWPCPNLKEAKK